MSALIEGLELTAVGMGVVLITLALLAILVGGMGKVISRSERKQTASESRKTAIENDQPAQGKDEARARRRAAAVAAVLAVLEETPPSSVPAVGTAWNMLSRHDAVTARAAFCQRKEHRAWHANS